MFPLTKSELLKNVEKFSEEKLVDYELKRNFDVGVPHENVSKLSPYIRRKFVTETEILKKIFKNHKYENIEKFVEEIFWRAYWRGWLETHPWIYKDYELIEDTNFIPTKTGIKCFDHWKDEIIETGYLHNHARMWFASIWIFTLGHSWESGANFFKNHLIDWCPASNTLGWRWVAGLQTFGKPYVAKAENIKSFTKGRFFPKNQLNEKIMFSEKIDKNKIALDFNLKKSQEINLDDSLGVIINNNDLALNNIFNKLKLDFECCLFNKKSRNNLVNIFEDGIYNDIIKENDNIKIIQTFEDIFKWIDENKIKNLIIPYETTGNKLFENKNFIEKIKEKKIKYLFYLRDWDKTSFPYAKKGFFNFKKNIPNILKMMKLL